MGGIRFTEVGNLAIVGAINGTSLDPGDRVILGQFTIPLGISDPAEITAATYIPINTASVSFYGLAQVGIMKFGSIAIAGWDNGIELDKDCAVVFTKPLVAATYWSIQRGANNVLSFETSDGGTIFEIDSATNRTSRLQTDFRIDGFSSFSRLLVDNVATPVTIQNTYVDSNKTFTNRGAVAAIVFQLPANPSIGVFHIFVVVAAFAVIVTAGAADTIRIGALVKAAGGNLQSATIGSVITVEFLGANQWVATSNIGAWV